jgi:hypothetical protein
MQIPVEGNEMSRKEVEGMIGQLERIILTLGPPFVPRVKDLKSAARRINPVTKLKGAQDSDILPS